MSPAIAIAPGKINPGNSLAALGFAAAGVFLLLPGGFWPLDVREQLVLNSVSVAMLSFAALRLVTTLPGNSQGISRWRLGPWYLMCAGVAFGLASLTWLGPQTSPATRIALSSVVYGLGVFGLSIAAWTVGYVAGPLRVIQTAANRGIGLLLRGSSTTIRGGLAPWGLYAIGTASRLTSVLFTGRFGYVGDPSGLVVSAAAYGQLLHILSTFALFAIAAAAYRAFNTTIRGGKATLWILVGIEVLIGAIAGGKESFVLSLLAVLIPYGATRGRLPLRVLLIGALLFLWIAVPFNQAYRDVVRSDSVNLTPSAAIEAAPEVFSGSVQSQSPAVTIVDSANAIFHRIREIDSIAIITQLTPDTIAYRSPWEFATAPVVGLTPRLLWPDKPILVGGYEFSQEYYGLPSTMYTSTAVTPLGDLYRHGGLWMVALGMLVLGAGCRLFDRLFRPETDPRALCFVMVFVPVVIKSEIDVQSLLTSIPGGILAAVIGARLMCRNRPPATEEFR